MSARYEVSYRNMWPSEDLNEHVRDCFTRLQHQLPQVEDCRCFFTQPRLGGELEFLVELHTPDDSLSSRCRVPAKSNTDLYDLIDRAFRELRSRFSVSNTQLAT